MADAPRAHKRALTRRICRGIAVVGYREYSPWLLIA